MHTLEPHAAFLDAGGEIVTASARQARVLTSRIGAQRARGGASAWPTPDIVPLGAWLERAAAALEDRPALLGQPAAARLWQQVVAASRAGERLISTRAAARDAERAWQLMAEFQVPAAALEAATAEQAAFRGWLRDYEGALAARDSIDRAQLPALLTGRAAEAFAPGSGRPLGLHGFGAPTPARTALVAALAAAGRVTQELALEAEAPRERSLEAATPEAELELAADWLAARLAADPASRLGLIVPDLEARGAQVARLLDDRLAPALKAPGAVDARPYVLAAGARLAAEAIVAVAAGVLALAEETVDVLALGRLLRSPYLRLAGGSRAPEEGASRAARLDVALRALGPRRLPARELVAVIRERRDAAPEVAATLEAVRAALGAGARRPAPEYADAWPRALRAAGWPGPRPLGAREERAARELYECFATFASLGRVLPPLAPSAARAELGELVANSSFEPEAGEPAVTVLGRHEDPGLPFDGLWVTGLTADRFPAAPAANPFLPLALQRRHGMPGATAEVALAAARSALAGWQRTSTELVLSSARLDGETRLLPAGLLPVAGALPAAPAQPARAAIIRAAARLEPWLEGRLPALAAGSDVAGGVRVLDLESACPFQAAARGRLGAEPLESPVAGLSRKLRGMLMHAALAHYWTEVRTHAAHLALGADGRAARAEAAVEAAFRTHRGYRPRGALADLERRWLARALVAFGAVELEREPFEVLALEARRSIEVAGFGLALRLDRLDRVGDATVVIDYKTGYGVPARWTGPRPDVLQLALYAAAEAEPPAAVALARLPLALAARERFVGAAARDGLLPNVRGPAATRRRELKGRDWPGLLAEWQSAAADLMRAYAGGALAVDPTPDACEHCRLATLCRVAPFADGAPGAADADGEAAEP